MTSWQESYIDAWNRHDAAAVAGFFAEDASYTDVALGESLTGREAIARFVEGAAGTVSSDYSVEKVYGLSTDTGYALEWIMKGTHDRSSPQVPATGRRFSLRGVSVGEREGGRIRRNTDYWNLTELLVQVGLTPTPAPAS